MRALLDVNVLIALHDPQNVHHGRAADWLEANADAGWASCPLTQNGCLRILSQPGYSNAKPIAALWPVLSTSFKAASHVFWPDDLSLFDARHFRHDRIHGHRQLTDIYLLALAVQHGGRFVTLDTRVPLQAVHGAQVRHLVAIAAPGPS